MHYLSKTSLACLLIVLSGSSLIAQEELPPLKSEDAVDPLTIEPSNQPFQIEPSQNQADKNNQGKANNSIDAKAEFETLTRGPLHEAFAETVSLDPRPGLIIPNAPPELIDEAPPEFRPDQEGMIWIPGYWGWDDDRDDFIWISGVYRLPPDGQRWVPGYWHEVENGWQWVSGFWVAEDVQEISYWNAPPSSLEVGPSSPAPSSNYFYIPGYWDYSTSGYQWRAGYWSPLSNGLVWVPARYVWTPNGYVFLNGYWDYRLVNRGYCFAPAYFPPNIYRQTGYYYQPSILLNTNGVFHNLFVRAGYNHYLFGNYYGSQYSSQLIQPVYMYHQSASGFDPLMSYYSAYYASQGRDLMKWYGSWHHQMLVNPSQRPPLHWDDHVKNRTGIVHEDNIAFSVNDYANSKLNSGRFVKSSQVEQKLLREQSKEWNHAAMNRQQMTTRDSKLNSPVASTNPKFNRNGKIGDSMQLPTNPITAVESIRKQVSSAKKITPPTPKPNLNVDQVSNIPPNPFPGRNPAGRNPNQPSNANQPLNANQPSIVKSLEGIGRNQPLNGNRSPGVNASPGAGTIIGPNSFPGANNVPSNRSNLGGVIQGENRNRLDLDRMNDQRLNDPRFNGQRTNPSGVTGRGTPFQSGTNPSGISGRGTPFQSGQNPFGNRNSGATNPNPGQGLNNQGFNNQRLNNQNFGNQGFNNPGIGRGNSNPNPNPNGGAQNENGRGRRR